MSIPFDVFICTPEHVGFVLGPLTLLHRDTSQWRKCVMSGAVAVDVMRVNLFHFDPALMMTMGNHGLMLSIQYHDTVGCEPDQTLENTRTPERAVRSVRARHQKGGVARERLHGSIQTPTHSVNM